MVTQLGVGSGRPSPGRMDKAVHKEKRMLVLTRKTGQSFRVGGDIVVTIVEVRGDQVRLGIQAPDAMAISRDELAVPRVSPGDTDPDPGETGSG